MLTANNLLKAQHIGPRVLTRDYKRVLARKEPVIIEVKSSRAKVIVSLDDLVELFDKIEDLQDRALLDLVRESRDASARGDKPVAVAELFKKIRGKKSLSRRRI
ncbi:MAG: hypothetical protein HQL11_03685 [Candidatus Omnitrophica bacterium]|nr:hypothetical protein [Candidatus Omnitrophota bacterium]